MIESDFLTELSRYEEAIDRTVDSMYQGQQESPEVGEGQTFSDHRRYTPGDDIRLVDWKVLARTGDVYIQRFEAERELTVHVLVDTSASMDFGDEDDGTHKFEYAAKLGLGVCFLASETQNDYRFATFGREFDRLDRGASNRSGLLQLLDRLNRTEPAGNTDFEDSLRAYAATINSRSLVVVISDFLEDPTEIETGLRSLANHETFAVQIVAPEERDLPVGGDAIFEDIETGQSLRAYFGGRLKNQYQDRLADHFDAVEARCRQAGATHLRADTGADFFETFGTLWRTLRTDQTVATE